MSRTAWMEDCDMDQSAMWEWIRWEGRKKKVLTGKPGLKALKEFEQVLLNMQHKELIEGQLCDGTGVCAIGAWIYRRWVDSGITPKEAWKKLQNVGYKDDSGYHYDNEDSFDQYDRTRKTAVKELGITETLAEIISQENDGFFDYYYKNIKSPKDRYDKILHWVQERIRSYDKVTNV